MVGLDNIITGDLSLEIVSILCLLEFIALIRLFNKYAKVMKSKIEIEEKLKEKEKELDKQEDYDAIMPGDKIHFKSNLSYNPAGLPSEHFTVRYEADVIEVSTDSVKVSPYEVTAETRIPLALTKIPNYEAALMEREKNKWIPKSDISPLMTPGEIRNRRINKVLGDSE